VTIDGSDGEVNMRVVAPHAQLSELTVDRVQALGGRVHVADDDPAIATVDVAIPMSEV
jgi:hypothetical protein